MMKPEVIMNLADVWEDRAASMREACDMPEGEHLTIEKWRREAEIWEKASDQLRLLCKLYTI